MQYIQYKLNFSFIDHVYCEEYTLVQKNPNPTSTLKEDLLLAAGVSLVVMLAMIYVGYKYGFTPPIEEIIETTEPE